jgi:hydroxymethylglutaryl-CoA lyase
MSTKIIETPRDAMQGISRFIPTQKKIAYLNALLEVGFDEMDYSSFVSPRAIPQLADSAQVISQLKIQNTQTKIMATIGNIGGAKRALSHTGIDAVAFPFSISEIFLQKNIRSNFDHGTQTIKDILSLCQAKNKELVLYIAMAFGNPYGDDWSVSILNDWTYRLQQMGVKTIILADTTGEGTTKGISESFAMLKRDFPALETGVHLHTTPDDWHEKVSASYEAGCRRFDTALGGFGGCPMSGKKLIGNLSTENLLMFLEQQGESLSINKEAFQKAQTLAAFTFSH